MCGHYSCAVKPSQVCVSNFAQPQRERVSKNVHVSPRCRTLTRHETLGPTPGRGHHKLSDQLQHPARSQIILHIACRPEHMWHRVSRRLSGRLGGQTARCLPVCSARARLSAACARRRQGGMNYLTSAARAARSPSRCVNTQTYDMQMREIVKDSANVCPCYSCKRWHASFCFFVVSCAQPNWQAPCVQCKHVVECQDFDCISSLSTFSNGVVIICFFFYRQGLEPCSHFNILTAFIGFSMEWMIILN